MNLIDINNRIKTFLKEEFSAFNSKEGILFLIYFVIITALSVIIHDNKIALVSAICGVSYTILNGKGKIYCYFFGIIGTLCYSYLALRNGLWGNFSLNFFYYFPMEIFGFFSWKKHLINASTIKKTKLNQKEKLVYASGCIAITVILAAIVLMLNLSVLNFLDFMTLFLSIIAMILAVKRCIEQWYCWIAVNFLSVIVWIIAYINGSNCLATIIMWLIYFLCGIYFLRQWKKEKI